MKTTILVLASRLRVGVLTVLLAVIASAGHAQNSIESVNVSPQPGGKIVIRVGLKEALASAPAGFTVNNPPRLAFDFASTSTDHCPENKPRSDHALARSQSTPVP